MYHLHPDISWVHDTSAQYIDLTWVHGRRLRVGGAGYQVLLGLLGDHQSGRHTTPGRDQAIINQFVSEGILVEETDRSDLLTPEGSREFTLLFVCTGNICRSAYAHTLVESAKIPGLRVLSAGTHAMVGYPMDRFMATEIPDGVEDREHVAQQLTRGLVDEADLIVAMSERHRSYIIDEWPDATSKTFLIGQVARSIGTATSIETLVSDLWNDRTLTEGDTVRDPYGKGTSAAQEAAVLLRAHVDHMTYKLSSLLTN